MKRAFVTGASGFIGRRLCLQLRERGFEVSDLSRETGEIRDPRNVEQALRESQAEWVFHLAGLSQRGDGPEVLTELFGINVLGTLNLLRAARLIRPRAVVVVGSFEEYGDNPTPFREDQAPRPRSPYGVTKAASSLLALSAAEASLPAAVVRFPVIYGPGQSVGTFVGGACAAIRAGTKFAMTAGEQTRDFLFVDDAAAALIAAAEGIDVCRGQSLNACTGVGLTLREAVRVIGEMSGHPDFAAIGARPYRDGEQMQYVGDCSRIRKLLQWQATTAFPDGIGRTLAG